MNEDKIDVEQIEPTADFTDELSDEALDRATAGVQLSGSLTSPTACRGVARH